MKVALIHDWLTGMRGGEKVLEAIAEVYPEADIFTLVHIPGSVSPSIESHRIYTSPLQKFPFIKKRYRHYLPFMPWAIEQLDLKGYDLVISSSHCVAKSVLVDSGALHLCYCHTPMRYIWEQYEDYFKTDRTSWPVRLAMSLLRKPLQRWDVKTSVRVHHYMANSRNVVGRINRYYGREADVVYPPVDLGQFEVTGEDKGFYLLVSALVPYKRVDLAVKAFKDLPWTLKIIGQGPDMDYLRSMASPNVEFLGWAGGETLVDHYKSCRAILFPGEEDFGIVPLEAMACGKPVIAYGRGGALETVVPWREKKDNEGKGPAPTGLYFEERTPSSLAEALGLFEKNRSIFDPQAIRRHAEPFNRDAFKKRLKNHVDEKWTEFQKKISLQS